MGRKSNAAAVGAGVLAAAGVMYVVVATAKPRQGSWRYKFKTWLEVKWPLTYRYLELLSPSPPADREEMIAAYVVCFCGSRSGAHHVDLCGHAAHARRLMCA